jgi:hypothetical protein
MTKTQEIKTENMTKTPEVKTHIMSKKIIKTQKDTVDTRFKYAEDKMVM